MTKSSLGSGWLLDFNIRVDRDTVFSLIDRSEEAALYRSSRYFRTYWLLIVCSLGGLFGGPIASGVLWIEPEWGMLTVVTLAVITLGIWDFHRELFGNLMKRRTAAAMLSGVAIAAIGQVGGQIGWGFAAFGGAAFGFLHGVFSRRSAHANLLWLPGTCCSELQLLCFGVYLISEGSAASMLPLVIAGGGTAAISFYVLILSFFSHYYTAAGGLRNHAQVYIHCDAMLPKAIAHLTEAIRIASGRCRPLQFARYCLVLFRRVEKAQADYRQVEAIRPMQIEPAMNHALDLARREEFDQSIEFSER